MTISRVRSIRNAADVAEFIRLRGQDPRAGIGISAGYGTGSAQQRFEQREARYGGPSTYKAPVPKARVSADRDRRRRELELIELGAPPSGELQVHAEGKHFWVTAYVDGTPVRMMLDTGATNTVLSAEDARRAGVAAEGQVDVLTARGTSRAATATIRRLAIGGATFHALPAVIVDRGGRDSLLGAEALGRFKSYEVRDGVLTLRW